MKCTILKGVSTREGYVVVGETLVEGRHSSCSLQGLEVWEALGVAGGKRGLVGGGLNTRWQDVELQVSRVTRTG